jgi:hypothetical protein
MRRFLLGALALVLTLPAMETSLFASRVWHDTQGRQLAADIVDADPTQVRLRRDRDGKLFWLKIDRLGAADQEFVRQWLAQRRASALPSDAGEVEFGTTSPLGPIDGPAGAELPEPPVEEGAAGVRTWLEAARDWRYFCATIFLGGLLGRWLFRTTPLPADAQPHVRMIEKAVHASQIADQFGHDNLQTAAGAVGIHAVAQIHMALHRQRRRCLIAGLCLAAAIVLPAFIALPVTSLPEWGFALSGVLGAYLCWGLW